MSRFQSSNTDQTQTLSSPSDNPFTVEPSDVINSGGQYGVYGTGAAGVAWTVINDGTVIAANEAIKLIPGTNFVASTVSNAGSINGGNVGIDVDGFATVYNLGRISAGSEGIYLVGGGYILNNPNAVITSKYAVVSAPGNNALKVLNEGTITGSAEAIDIGGSGSVTNTSAGTISGQINFFGTGGSVSNAGGIGANYIIGGTNFTVTNSGTISGFGLDFGPNARLTNSGRLSENVGISINGQGTILNSGTIVGGVTFSGNGLDRVIFDTGAVFGTVIGGTGSNTLELAGSGTGTLNGLGSTFENFGTVVEDAGVTWVLNNTDTLNGTLVVDGTLTNNGLYLDPGSVILVNGGQLTNNATLANTTAFSTGVTLSSGTVLNAGSISGVAVGVAVTGGHFYNELGATVQGTGIGAVGVYVAGPTAGAITNTGTISGAQDAVVFSGSTASRLILNPGGSFIGGVAAQSTDTLELAGITPATLSGFGTEFTGFGAITADFLSNWTLNSSDTIGAAVVLSDGGTLTNTGSIATTVIVTGQGNFIDTGTVTGGTVGVTVTGIGTVVDSGRISGSTTAISFANNARNLLMLSAAASFQGTVAGGNMTTLELVSSASTGTLNGFGTSFTGFASVNVDQGASWVLNATGAVSTSTTITDSGTLLINGLIGTGIAVTAGGSLINAGAITTPQQSINTLDETGVSLNGAGSSLTNQAGGLIEAGQFVVVSTAQNTTVTNAGVIEGTHDGVVMFAGGSVTNSGEIDGFGNVGVYFTGGAGTLTNTGTINGGISGAVQFAGSFADRVIVTPNAVFGGVVTGGSGTNTLELAAASGSGTLSLANGTITALGSSFVNFSTIVMDQGASWTVGGAGAFAGVTNAGTLSGAVTVAALGAVSNSGTIAGGALGVRLLGSGSLNNQTSGTISASNYVVEGNGTGEVVNNQGVLSGTHDGVVLFDGGSVNNVGTITGAGNIGIYISGAAGTVTNRGTIIGAASGAAVQFVGNFTDRLVLLPGAVTMGKVLGGNGSNTLELAQGPGGAIGTLNGFGNSIVNFGTVLVDLSSSWQFGATDSFAAGAVLQDSGLLTSSGTIGTTVTIQSHGTVNNSGSIAGATDGVSLVNSGTVVNTAAASISGNTYGIGVNTSSNPTSITNAGSITGGMDGVVLFGQGTLVNSGNIIGTSNFGVYGKGSDTVTNSGTIRGATEAVDLTGSNNRLIITPEAVFSGKVLGGGASNTLELAASSAAATGTLSGFGTSIANFPNITIDAGASWVTNTTDQLGGGLLITDKGTLGNSGVIGSAVSIQSNASLQNSGTLATTGIAAVLAGSNAGFSNLAGGLVNSNANDGTRGDGTADTVTNAGTVNGATNGVVLMGGGVVTNSGSITGAGNVGVYLNGGNSTLTNSGVITGGAGAAVQFVGSFADRVIVTPNAIFQGTVAGGTGSNTLELAAGSAGSTGTLIAQNGLLFGLRTTFSNFGTIVVDQGASWSVSDVNSVGSTVNQGTLSGTVSIATSGEFDNGGSLAGGSNAVVLLGSGVFNNTATGVATGTHYGVFDATAGASITNAGSITGALDGAVLLGGGTLNNSGVLTGTSNIGFYARGGATTVTNSGTIGGAIAAIEFVGSFSNRLILQPGATFNGRVSGGSGPNTLELAAGSAGSIGTLTGFGPTITGFNTIVVDQGASWLLNANDTVSAAVTLTDSGMLKTTGTLNSTVTVTGTGTLDNGGTIVGNGNALHGAVSMTGGSFINEAGATMSSDRFTVGATGGAATVTNYGVINGTHDGVVLFAGGSVTNTGSISGGNNVGIYIKGGAGTVTNSGTIGAGASGAIQFVGSYADRVILTPGAVEGKVTGGSGSNTLELAAGTNGAVGTLTGFGTNFVNFQTVVLDAGASWVFSPSDEIGSGTTLVNQSTIATALTISAGGLLDNVASVGGVRLLGASGLVNEATGSITNSNIAVYDTDGFASVTNAGSITGARDGVVLYDSGNVTNSGVIATGTVAGTGNIGVYVANGGNVTNTGTIAGLADAVLFTGTGASNVVMSSAAVFQGNVVGNNSGMNTLELTEVDGQPTSGTLSGFGSQFTNFQTLEVLSGVAWSFNATDTFGAGSTIYSFNGDILGPVTLAQGGVLIQDGIGQVVTVGSVASAVQLTGFDTVNNESLTSRIINNYGDGIDGSGAGNTIDNTGAIHGLNDSVRLQAGGTVDNLSTGVIQATNGDAIYIQGGGTVTNAGFIYALGYTSGADAVHFVGTAADRVILVPGAVFLGAVQGGSGSNVLELSGTASTQGTLSNFGTTGQNYEFENFGTIQLDNGASWKLSSSDVLANTAIQFLGGGTLETGGYVPATSSISFGGPGDTLQIDSPGSFVGLLSGIGVGDTISLGNAATISSASSTGNSLTLDTSSNTNYVLRLGGVLPSNTSLHISTDQHSVSLVAS